MPIFIRAEEAMGRRFEALVLALGGIRRESNYVFHEIIEKRYSAEDRHYHNLKHIEACLDILESKSTPPVNEPFQTSFTIELALWFHDLIYDPIANDNEERSAAELQRLAPRLRIPDSVLKSACNAILATQHHATPVEMIDRYVVDIDLAILGHTPGEFDVYEQQIRKEYAFVGDTAWAQGRSAVLKRFLDREWIYSTPEFRRRYEGAARYNLKRSLDSLSV